MSFSTFRGLYHALPAPGIEPRGRIMFTGEATLEREDRSVSLGPTTTKLTAEFRGDHGEIVRLLNLLTAVSRAQAVDGSRLEAEAALRDLLPGIWGEP